MPESIIVAALVVGGVLATAAGFGREPKIADVAARMTAHPRLRLARPLLFALGLALTACAREMAGGAPTPPAGPEQARLFYNGQVLTGAPNPPASAATALLVRGDKIEAVGADAELLARREPATLLIDLQGRVLQPGFVDAHTHVFNDARAQGLSLDQAQMLALQSGITTLGDLYVDQQFLRRMQDFARTGQLRVRTSLYLVHNGPCGEDYGDWWQAYPPTRVPGEMLRVGGIKVFLDGGSCGGVALSFERATDTGGAGGADGAGHGDLWLTQAELNQVMRTAQAAGHQVAIHAIGDRAVAQALDAVADALAGGPNALRHRVEHVSIIPPGQLARFGQLGLIPVIPGQYPSCTPFGPPLPEAYGAWEWPWRALLEQNPGLPVAWHSDYPFWSINPFIHLYGFVTRQDVYHGYYTCRPQAWLKDDTLPVETALAIMTRGSAYALFREEEVGSLLPGQYADLIVISGNPLTVPAEDLRRLSVLMTMVGGRVEYCVGAARDLCPGYENRTPAPLPDFRPPEPVRWLTLFLIIGVPLGAGAVGVFRRRPSGRLTRLGGLAGSAGGALWLLAGWLAPDDWPRGQWAGMSFIAAAAFGLGVAGLAAAGRPGWLGRLSLGLAGLGAAALGAGLILSAWFQLDWGWPVWLIGLLSHTGGLIGFGLANIRVRGRPQLNSLPILMGLLGGPVPFVAGSVVFRGADWPLALLIGALGLGWLTLGAALLLWPGQRPAGPPARDQAPAR